MERTRLTGILLAGGESRRMGQPKALLPFGDEVLVQRVARLLGEACDRVVVVARRLDDLPGLGLRVVADESPGLGPVGGLQAGLAAADTDWVALAGCDLPFLSPAVVRLLARQRGGAQAVVPIVGGRGQYLLALYGPDARPVVDEMVRGGGGAMRTLVADPRLRTRFMQEEAIRAVDPDLLSFTNVNSVQEYQRALETRGWGRPFTLGVIARRASVTTEGLRAGEPGTAAAEPLHLSIAYMPNVRLRPLIDGEVRVEGVQLDWELAHPNIMHLKHLREDTFDLFEMSLAVYLSMMGKPDKGGHDWIGVPVFMAKGALAMGSLVNTDSGVRSFADLRGKRFGVPDFGMTGAVWLRIMLRELYGIEPSEIVWVNGRPSERRQDFAAGAKPVPGVEIHDKPEDRTLQQMLESGEVDAAFGDSDVAGVEVTDTVKPLVTPQQGREVLADLWNKKGATPVNHALLVQRKLADAHPELAKRLFHALEQSKQAAYRTIPGACALFPGDKTPYAEQIAAFGGDPYPFGLSATRRSLELLARQLVEEGQIDSAPEIDSLFVESLRDS